jgi:hypothetical protein
MKKTSSTYEKPFFDSLNELKSSMSMPLPEKKQSPLLLFFSKLLNKDDVLVKDRLKEHKQQALEIENTIQLEIEKEIENINLQLKFEVRKLEQNINISEDEMMSEKKILQDEADLIKEITGETKKSLKTLPHKLEKLKALVIKKNNVGQRNVRDFLEEKNQISSLIPLFSEIATKENSELEFQKKFSELGKYILDHDAPEEIKELLTLLDNLSTPQGNEKELLEQQFHSKIDALFIENQGLLQCFSDALGKETFSDLYKKHTHQGVKNFFKNCIIELLIKKQISNYFDPKNITLLFEKSTKEAFQKLSAEIFKRFEAEYINQEIKKNFLPSLDEEIGGSLYFNEFSKAFDEKKNQYVAENSKKTLSSLLRINTIKASEELKKQFEKSHYEDLREEFYENTRNKILSSKAPEDIEIREQAKKIAYKNGKEKFILEYKEDIRSLEGCGLFLMSETPKEMSENSPQKMPQTYLQSYLFLEKEKESMQIFYVKKNGTFEQLKMVDFDGLMPLLEQVKNNSGFEKTKSFRSLLKDDELKRFSKTISENRDHSYLGKVARREALGEIRSNYDEKKEKEKVLLEYEHLKNNLKNSYPTFMSLTNLAAKIEIILKKEENKEKIELLEELFKYIEKELQKAYGGLHIISNDIEKEIHFRFDNIDLEILEGKGNFLPFLEELIRKQEKSKGSLNFSSTFPELLSAIEADNKIGSDIQLIDKKIRENKLLHQYPLENPDAYGNIIEFLKKRQRNKIIVEKYQKENDEATKEVERAIRKEKIEFIRGSIENAKNQIKEPLVSGIPEMLSVYKEILEKSEKKKRILEEEDKNWETAKTKNEIIEKYKNTDIKNIIYHLEEFDKKYSKIKINQWLESEKELSIYKEDLLDVSLKQLESYELTIHDNEIEKALTIHENAISKKETFLKEKELTHKKAEAAAEQFYAVCFDLSQTVNFEKITSEIKLLFSDVNKLLQEKDEKTKLDRVKKLNAKILFLFFEKNGGIPKSINPTTLKDPAIANNIFRQFIFQFLIQAQSKKNIDLDLFKKISDPNLEFEKLIKINEQMLFDIKNEKKGSLKNKLRLEQGKIEPIIKQLKSSLPYSISPEEIKKLTDEGKDAMSHYNIISERYIEIEKTHSNIEKYLPKIQDFQKENINLYKILCVDLDFEKRYLQIKKEYENSSVLSQPKFLAELKKIESDIHEYSCKLEQIKSNIQVVEDEIKNLGLTVAPPKAFDSLCRFHTLCEKISVAIEEMPEQKSPRAKKKWEEHLLKSADAWINPETLLQFYQETETFLTNIHKSNTGELFETIAGASLKTCLEAVKQTKLELESLEENIKFEKK